MSQVNCAKHSMKRLQYVPHDLTLHDENNDSEVKSIQNSAVACQSTRSSPPSHIWELCYLRGTWVPYPDDTCRLLEGVCVGYLKLIGACFTGSFLLHSQVLLLAPLF